MNPRSLESRISASLVRLRARAPFFGVLALFARFRAADVPTAATDGVDVLYNPEWLGALEPPELDAVLLHEVLHAALLHVVRRQEREPVRWNTAADVVVNGMIARMDSLRLPAGAVRAPAWEERPVEEIYALLAKKKPEPCPSCLRIPEGEDVTARRPREVEAHWRQALHQAAAVLRTSQQGELPEEVQRLLSELSQPRVDWRARLWRFLVRTPVDFGGYDRRFIGRKLYLEGLEGESIAVRVCVDTSGSIDSELLTTFLSELMGVLQAYPHLEATLYYADAELHGPYVLNSREPRLPPPVGGGGTSFVPFFQEIAREGDPVGAQTVCIYLTDGFGTFPTSEPLVPVLWGVPPGGLEPKSFPFGEVVCLL